MYITSYMRFQYFRYLQSSLQHIILSYGLPLVPKQVKINQLLYADITKQVMTILDTAFVTILLLHPLYLYLSA